MSSRETELYKDRVEVSLDGRQIFYLFFGGAVIVGLVFILGVMIGRRVEARGHLEKARTHAATDPLAALDRLEDRGGLTFQNTLVGARDGKPTPVEQAIAERAKQKPTDAKAVDAKPADAKPKAEANKPADDDHASDKHDDKPGDKAKAADDKVTKKPEPKAGEAKPDDKVAAKPAVADKKPVDADNKPEAPKSKFTLQLSSFQDRAEADTFLSTIKAAGYQAYVTEASVTGKTYYRVRLGKYGSLEAANDAKSDFETKSKKTASVMKL
ncbi:MAG: SPOR domain-containing protein [Kofleriaceae bacterium]